LKDNVNQNQGRYGNKDNGIDDSQENEVNQYLCFLGHRSIPLPLISATSKFPSTAMHYG
jgi:hypothetical protein